VQSAEEGRDETKYPTGAKRKEECAKMTWEGLGGTLNSGQTLTWWYSWGGQDKGAQLALGNPKNPGGEIVSWDFAKKIESDGKTTYSVTIKNRGTFATNYSLQGGGLT
jgi:hypothetical protein